VTERSGNLIHDRDAILIKPSAIPALQQDEAAADFLHKRASRAARISASGTKHRGIARHRCRCRPCQERLAGLQRDRGVEQSARNITISPGRSSISKIVRRNDRREIRHHGSAPRTRNRVDLRPFSFSFSIPNKVFIGFERPVPPNFPLATSSVNPASAGLRNSPRTRPAVLTPGHEGGRTADSPRLRSTGWRSADRSAMVRPVAPQGSGIAETPQQVGGIDRAAVRFSRQRARSLRAIDAT